MEENIWIIKFIQLCGKSSDACVLQLLLLPFLPRGENNVLSTDKTVNMTFLAWLVTLVIT